MEIYFNELSLSQDVTYDKYMLISVIKFLISKDIRKCRTDGSVILSLINDVVLNRDEKRLILSFIIKPFNTTDNLDSYEDGEYINNQWYYGEKPTIGITYAISSNTFVLSLNNKEFDCDKISAHRQIGLEEEKKLVSNIANQSQFDEIINFINSKLQIVIEKTKLSIAEKKEKSKLPTDHHHGTDILAKYIDKIIGNDYIDYVITSIHQCNSNKFIRVDLESKTIDIRLYWVDRHPAIKIKPSSEDINAINKIAEIFEKELPRE